MAAPLMTIAECDARLLACREAYCDALDAGDLESADAAYELLDSLLDQRLHLPQQRRTVLDRLRAP